MMNHRCYFPLRTAISFTRLRLTGISNKNRWFATSARQDNSAITLLKRLRSETQTSITKAKEALKLNDNDYDKALEWLLEDAKRSGATRAEKVKGRIAKEQRRTQRLDDRDARAAEKSTGLQRCDVSRQM